MNFIDLSNSFFMSSSTNKYPSRIVGLTKQYAKNKMPDIIVCSYKIEIRTNTKQAIKKYF